MACLFIYLCQISLFFLHHEAESFGGAVFDVETPRGVAVENGRRIVRKELQKCMWYKLVPPKPCFVLHYVHLTFPLVPLTTSITASALTFEVLNEGIGLTRILEI